MNVWQEVAALLFRFIDQYDEPAVALFILVEEAGLPLPVPGDLVMLLAGYRVAQGQMNLLVLLGLLQAATMLGASTLYWLAARGGRPLLHRYGRFLRVDAAKLDRAEGWLHRHGGRAILAGRLLPGLRIATPLAAGAFGMPYRAFLPPLALGAFLYIAAFVLLGLWLGPRAIQAVEGLRLSLRAGLTGLLFAAVGAAFIVLARRAGRQEPAAARPVAPGRPETAALAGFLATLEMGLGVDLLLYLAGGLGVLRPERALLELLGGAADRWAGGSSVKLGLLLVVLVIGSNALWAVLYAGAAERRLPGPGWARGLLFAALPLAAWGLLVLPALGAGPLGLHLGPMPLAGAVVCYGLFGLGLGIACPLLERARGDGGGG